MALTAHQLWITRKIDTRMQKLARAGKDELAILTSMIDHMPGFKHLLDTAQPDEMDELARKFPGFHHYAKILEAIAGGIRDGTIEVPK